MPQVSLPTTYQVKRAVLYPRILVKRRQERHQPDFMRHALELTNYSRSAYGFIGARMENHGILCDVTLGPGAVALDVGAYVGSWATAVSARTDGGTIHSFELSPAIVPHLLDAVAGDERIVPHAYGLGGADSTVLVSRRGLGSSVFNVDEAGSDEGIIRDVAEVFRELELERVAVMKINIEGGEYDLLDRMAGAGLLDRVDCYLIQFHEWIRGAYSGRRRIHRELARTHRLVWDYPFVWKRWERQ